VTIDDIRKIGYRPILSSVGAMAVPPDDIPFIVEGSKEFPLAARRERPELNVE
jgi:hypothetical protein